MNLIGTSSNPDSDKVIGAIGERMRKVGAKGAPTAAAFKASARTAKRK